MDRFIKLIFSYICSNLYILIAVLLIHGEYTCISDNYANQNKVNRFETWSLNPIAKQSLPSLNQTEKIWAKNPIDYFIVAKLNEKNSQYKQDKITYTYLNKPVTTYNFLKIIKNITEQ